MVVQSLPNGPRKVLVRGAYYGRYLPSGHLLYVQNATLFAAPFDLERLEVTGPAVPALQGATVNMPVGAAEIAMSDAGTIAYLPAPQYVDTLYGRANRLDESRRHVNAAPDDAGAMAASTVSHRMAVGSRSTSSTAHSTTCGPTTGPATRCLA